MARYFTVEEARRRLPQVEAALRDALFQKAEYQRHDWELEQMKERIRFAGGSRVNPGPILSLRAQRDGCARDFKKALERVEETGAVVKDLEIGLIDFMTRYRGEEVCLCWKLGEDTIRYWHGADEGFRGRKTIDAEFLEHHSASGPD